VNAEDVQQALDTAGIAVSNAFYAHLIHNAELSDQRRQQQARLATDASPAEALAADRPDLRNYPWCAVAGCSKALVRLAAVVAAQALMQLQRLQKDSSSSSSNSSKKQRRSAHVTRQPQQHMQAAATSELAQQLLSSVGVKIPPDALLAGSAVPLGKLAHNFSQSCIFTTIMTWMHVDDEGTSSSSNDNAAAMQAVPGSAASGSAPHAQQQQQRAPAWLLPLSLAAIEVAAAWPIDNERQIFVTGGCISCLKHSIEPLSAAGAAQLLPPLLSKLGGVALEADDEEAAAAKAKQRQQQQQQQGCADGQLDLQTQLRLSMPSFSKNYYEVLEALLLAGAQPGYILIFTFDPSL
jgi:hypothetical protein